MPIRAHCPNCQADYTLVDSLRDKYVRCERCRQSFRAEVARLERAGEPPAMTDLPPIQLSPAARGDLPRTVISAGESTPSEAPATRSQRGSSVPSRGSRAGFPVGIVFVLFLVVRACMSLSTSSSNNNTSRWHTPDPPGVKLPDNVQFRLVKDKGIVVIPKENNDAKLPDIFPRFGHGNDKEQEIVPKDP
jgi:predicted Zn finger-like uncharacterized protein